MSESRANMFFRGRMQKLAKRAFRRLGYAVRDVGTRVAGVDLFHDANVLLGNRVGSVLFDVGANVGQSTRAMLDSFSSPRIYAFEPSPTTVEQLRREVGRLPGVTIETSAMGRSEGMMPFHVTADHSVNDSLLTPTWQAGGTVVQVKVDKLETYCARNGIESIGLLKVDAQGYDLQVLEGARGLFIDRRIRLYCCEANFEHMYEGQAGLLDLLGFAEAIGYRLVGFYEQTYVKDRLSYLDILFESPSSPT